jgi:hypothetical protein
MDDFQALVQVQSTIRRDPERRGGRRDSKRRSAIYRSDIFGFGKIAHIQNPGSGRRLKYGLGYLVRQSRRGSGRAGDHHQSGKIRSLSAWRIDQGQKIQDRFRAAHLAGHRQPDHVRLHLLCPSSTTPPRNQDAWIVALNIHPVFPLFSLPVLFLITRFRNSSYKRVH